MKAREIQERQAIAEFAIQCCQDEYRRPDRDIPMSVWLFFISRVYDVTEIHGGGQREVQRDSPPNR